MHTRTLVVNAAADTNQIRVNLLVAVNSADIRRETLNGREHLVIPSYTLPSDIVMNGGLYPAEEIDRSYASLENTLAPLGHPMIGDQYVSARAPEAINAYHVGAFNRNVEKRGNRVYLEKFVDVQTASQSEGGRALLAAVAAGEPIHTSTGVFLRQEQTKGDGYDWIARDMEFDHDAILLGEIGAATPEQGVGMMVNVAQAVPVGERVLGADTWGARFEALDQALRERFKEPDSWVCLENFDSERAVFSTAAGKFYVAYTWAEGAGVTIDGEPAPVKSETAYFAQNGLVNKFWQWMRNALSSDPATPPEPSGDQDMTPEEMKAALDAQADKLTQAVNAAVAPVSDLAKRLDAIEAAMAANAEAGLAEKRKAAAEHLGVEADTLAGMTANQLDAVLAKSLPAAPLLGGMPQVNAAALADYDKPVA